MNTKNFAGGFRVKDANKGEFTAVFSTFNVIDSDGDVTLPGAFADGTPVRISAYGHASWGGVLPVGKGVVRTTDKEAIVEGQFFMDVPEAKSTFLVVKNMDSMQEWSYSVEPTKWSYGEFEGQEVQFLEKLEGPHEVSPVLAGAGVGTRTLSVKGAPRNTTQGRRPIAPHETDVVSRSWDALKMMAAIPDDARPSDLRGIYAWVSPEGDPEAKSSYRFPHHHGVKGAANIRACMAGIAALNGGGSGIPDADREAVYKHLAAHVRDADREVPELRAQPGGEMKFSEEGAAVMAAVSTFLDRASEVLALRAKKGKGLAPASADLIAWIADDLGRLKALLENPHLGAEEPLGDQEISTLMAGIAHVHGI